MKVTLYTKYYFNGPSSRVRLLQFSHYYRSIFDNVIIRPLFGTRYIDSLNRGKRSYLYIFYCYIRRLFNLIFDNSDLLIIEKELFPYIPFLIEKKLLCNKKYIIDIDDDIDRNYNLSIFSFLFRNKINNLTKGATQLWAGNLFLYNKFDNSDKKLIPSTTKNIGIKNKNNSKIVIGWIGTAATSVYLDLIFVQIKMLMHDNNIKFVTMGYYGKYIDEVDNTAWSSDAETDFISSLDIGLMPLSRSEFDLGKCSYKLIQYMSSGVIPVGEEFGNNIDVIAHNFNGLLLDSRIPNIWYASLSTLIANKNLMNIVKSNSYQTYIKKYDFNDIARYQINNLKNVK